jgi:hypothetical protein
VQLRRHHHRIRGQRRVDVELHQRRQRLQVMCAEHADLDRVALVGGLMERVDDAGEIGRHIDDPRSRGRREHP